MKDSTVLQVTKPVKWYNKKVNTNFKKLFLALTKSVIMGLAQEPVNAVSEGVGTIDAFKLNNDPGGLAYLLILKSMVNSAHDLASENQFKFRKDFQELEKLYDDEYYIKFLNQIDTVLEKKELTINKNTLTNPRSLSILGDFCLYFEEWIKFFGISNMEAATLANRLSAYFVLAFNEEWRSNSSSYEILVENLETPATQAAREELEWMHYNAFLQKQAEQPVFDEAFSLRQIYVPLRAYFFKKEIIEKKETKVVIQLEKELENWLLNTIDPKDAIKVISGGPGSGKSTVVKIWAANIAAKENIRVVFIPLHFFDLQSDLEESLEKFMDKNIDIPISYQSLKHGGKTLLIFDGLDELSQQGEYAAEVARKFVHAVNQQSDYRNRPQNIRVLFLLTGREIVIQSNFSDFREKKQILHLLPYYIKNDERKKYKDENNFLMEDQRYKWWKNYYQLTQKQAIMQMPQELRNENLDEITAQPLLNYLVALSKKRGKINFSEDTDLNEIYNDLIEGVYERAYEGRKYKAIESMELEDFKQILEAIAIAAWQGGDLRTTTVNRIYHHIERDNLNKLLDGFKESAKRGVTRLLTAFYFREYGDEGGEPTFEFTHKSFGEYLTASRLVKMIGEVHQQLQLREKGDDAGWDMNTAIRELLKITGEFPIDEYLFQFIRNEVKKNSVTILKQWQGSLSQLFSHILKHSSLVIKSEATIKENWRLSRNTEETLFVLLNACAIQTKTASKIEYPSKTSMGEWLSKIHSQRTQERPIVIKCLAYYSFKGQILFHQDFYAADLEGANLEGANLEGANLSGADLSGAKLHGTSLSGAKLDNANLEGVSWKGANLVGANLEKANLGGANLERANLERANLERANLEGANLEGANLERANLGGANLGGANLEGANLYEAYLAGAWLNKTYLVKANLRGANLKYANLRESNLRGANLREVNLRETDLREADLMNVDLGEARYYVADQFVNAKSVEHCIGILPEIEALLKRLRLER